ncbi:OLC1v1007998C1 [Oldenlandia corymbosa var. corymbosa]|uniref:OLC1v1007998C1 n=1 Tax=Oldenlandia corymbosa var. corymbosa TaxID=529605 RepID=A0AAV1DN36_OLDCO|nr:OLC1v1007998C1 [Oldenlandia corymbosa var. corymbosa]
MSSASIFFIGPPLCVRHHHRHLCSSGAAPSSSPSSIAFFIKSGDPIASCYPPLKSIAAGCLPPSGAHRRPDSGRCFSPSHLISAIAAFLLQFQLLAIHLPLFITVLQNFADHPSASRSSPLPLLVPIDSGGFFINFSVQLSPVAAVVPFANFITLERCFNQFRLSATPLVCCSAANTIINSVYCRSCTSLTTTLLRSINFISPLSHSLSSPSSF